MIWDALYIREKLCKCAIKLKYMGVPHILNRNMGLKYDFRDMIGKFKKNHKKNS